MDKAASQDGVNDGLRKVLAEEEARAKEEAAALSKKLQKMEKKYLQTKTHLETGLGRYRKMEGQLKAMYVFLVSYI